MYVLTKYNGILESMKVLNTEFDINTGLFLFDVHFRDCI